MPALFKQFAFGQYPINQQRKTTDRYNVKDGILDILHA
jgi:hypothetical protein